MAAKTEKKERYLRISDGLFQSEAFRTMPDKALKLWIDLRTQFFGDNNGRLVITLRRLAPRGWNSNSKLRLARNELLARGLIRLTKYCGPNVFHRASMYAFTDLETARNEAQGIAGASAPHTYLTWTKGAVICVHSSAVPNGTRRRCDTAPTVGERTPKTAPPAGERQISRKAAPILALRPKRRDFSRSPAGGDISSSTTAMQVRRDTAKADGALGACAPWEAT